jgi:SM-20-related protein
MLAAQRDLRPAEPETFLDLGAFRQTALRTEPYPYLIVPHFVRPERLGAINADFPEIVGPGSFPPDSLRYGSAFAGFIAALESPALRDAFAEKFALDLAGRPSMITVRGHIKQANGDIHTDTRSKLITVLLYLNREWTQPGGRLRILRSNAMDDLVTEIAPVDGTMLAFRVTPHSWHGHLPAFGERRALQLNWVTDEGVKRRELQRHRLSAGVKRLKRLFG